MIEHTIDPHRPIVTKIILGIIKTTIIGIHLQTMGTPTVVDMATTTTTAGMAAIVVDIRMIVAFLEARIIVVTTTVAVSIVVMVSVTTGVSHMMNTPSLPNCKSSTLPGIKLRMGLTGTVPSMVMY